MPKRKNILLGVTVIAVLVVAILFGDYWSRCHGKPLNREEALQRAKVRLQSLSQSWVLGSPLPGLVQEQYEPLDKTWSFTFRNDVCEVDIIADRCHGTDVGGMSKGCTAHQPEKR